MLQPIGWRELCRFSPGALLTNSFVSAFNIDNPCIFPTFRCVVTAFTAGSVTVRLRFGFAVVDTQASAQFIQFATLAAVNASDVRSFAWGLGAAAPNAAGNENSILPPRCEVAVDTIAATALTFAVYGSWLRVA